MGKSTMVDVSNNIVTISTTPVILHGAYINTTLSAHVCVIKDGATAKYYLPASAAAGTYYEFKGDPEFDNLIVDPDDSMTGSITVEYTPKPGAKNL